MKNIFNCLKVWVLTMHINILTKVDKGKNKKKEILYSVHVALSLHRQMNLECKFYCSSLKLDSCCKAAIH